MNGFDNTDQSTFSFEIGAGKQSKSGCLILPLRGHLTAEGAPKLSEELTKLLDAGATQVELECTDLDFISSTGIGSIVAAVGDYRDVGGDVVLSGLSEGLRAVFESLDLLDYIIVR
jgi:anti-sigma B factor antagonist